MYVTLLLERLIEPILFNKTCEVEIRELVENKTYLYLENNTIKLVINNF